MPSDTDNQKQGIRGVDTGFQIDNRQPDEALRKMFIGRCKAI